MAALAPYSSYLEFSVANTKRYSGLYSGSIRATAYHDAHREFGDDYVDAVACVGTPKSPRRMVTSTASVLSAPFKLLVVRQCQMSLRASLSSDVPPEK